MCEYCDIESNKPLIYVNASTEKENDHKLVIDIKQVLGRWVLNATSDSPHVYYGGELEINFCPVCGKRLSRDFPLVNSWIDANSIERSCQDASEILGGIESKVRELETQLQQVADNPDERSNEECQAK